MRSFDPQQPEASAPDEWFYAIIETRLLPAKTQRFMDFTGAFEKDLSAFGMLYFPFF